MTRADGFPFQDGQPFAPSPWRWAIALLSVVGGLAGLMIAGPVFGQAQPWIGVLLFTGLPFLGLLVLTGGRPGLVFRRPGWQDIGVGAGFALLNLVATPLIALAVTRLFQTAANPIGDALATLSPAGLPAFLSLTGFQLIGEELVTVLPFLAVLVLAGRLGLGQRASIAIAALTAALLFAAMHLPTYQWHLAQTVIIIGSARLILLGAYLLTRNLWASVIAHILNDWTLFGALILLPHLAP